MKATTFPIPARLHGLALVLVACFFVPCALSFAQVASGTKPDDPAWLAGVYDALAAKTDPREAADFLEKRLGEASRPADKRAIAVRLADIEILRGDLESAAGYYTTASFAVPGNRDFSCLLQAAWAYFSLGDDGHALASVTVVRQTDKDRDRKLEGRLIEALVSMRKDDFGSARRALDEVLAVSAFARRPLALLADCVYSSAHGPGLDAAVAKLRREFPDSPESAIADSLSGRSGAAPVTGAKAVSVFPTPFWLLEAGGIEPGAAVPSPQPPKIQPGSVPAKDSAAQVAKETASAKPGDETKPAVGADAAAKGGDAAKPAAGPAKVGEPAGSGKPSVAASKKGGSSDAGNSISKYQIGSFSRIENANNLAAELKGKGFKPVITEKKAEGKSFWAVSVPVSGSASDLATRLKDAGYETYPIFE
jgi:cell division septation protein DedD